MDSSLKQRLVGAIVLVALAVIFLPMLVKGPAPDSGVADVSMGIPAEPRNDQATQTIDLPLGPAASAPMGGVVGMPANESANEAGAQLNEGPSPTTAAGDYVVSFGSYATAADADRVIVALRSAQLAAYREPTQVNGRDAQRVRIGPFADRAVAESARLQAGKVNNGVDARVVALDAGTPAPAPAPATVAATPLPAPAPASVPASAKPAPPPPAPKPVATAPKVAAPVVAAAVAPAPPPPAAKPVATPAADTSRTGFAVQVGAFASGADANALRDKARAAGFNAFTDIVNTDKGNLTRVRIGPAMNRAEADALKASVKAKLGLDGMVRPHP